MQKLRPPDYKKDLERCNQIIQTAKSLEGLERSNQWKEVVNWINRKIEILEIKKKIIECAELCEANKYIPTDRELAEIKAIARQIQAFEEVRDIEKNFNKGVNEAIKEKERIQKLIAEQEKPKVKRKYNL